MKHMIIAAGAAALLAGCATTDGAPAAMACKADAAKSHIGHDATQAMGDAILKDSGARSLRWGPPGSAWTMDYREDRVNVRYDDRMKITDVTCG